MGDKPGTSHSGLEDVVGSSIALITFHGSETQNNESEETKITTITTNFAGRVSSVNQAHHARSSNSAQPRQRLTRREKFRRREQEATVEEIILYPSPRYLHTQLNFLYYSCLTTYKRKSILDNEYSPSMQTIIYGVHILQKVIVGVVICLSLFQSCSFTKLKLLEFLRDREQSTFVDFGFFLATILIKLCWIYLMTYWKSKIDDTLDSIEQYEEHILERVQTERCVYPKVHKVVKRVVILGIITWVAAITKSIFSGGISISELKNRILENSEVVAEAVLDWDTQQVENKTDIFYEMYGKTLNTSTILLGTVGLLGNLFSRVQLMAIGDTFLFLILTLGSNVKRFIVPIKVYADIPMTDVREHDREKMAAYWETYRKVKDIVLDMNSAFGTLLKNLHFVNKLFLSYFMSKFLDKDSSTHVLVFMAYSLCKSMISYVLAVLTYKCNSICEKWILNWAGRKDQVKIGNEIWKAKTLLKELKKEPLAVGEGNFVIDEMFLFKGLALAVSLLLFLVNAAKEECVIIQ